MFVVRPTTPKGVTRLVSFRGKKQGCSGAGTRGDGVPTPFSCLHEYFVKYA